MTIIAAVRLRGVRHINPGAARTLELLRLNRPNHCVILNESRETLGMLQKAKDFIAYGPVDEQTLLALLKKRAMKGSRHLREVADVKKMEDIAKQISGGKKVSEFANPVFRLRPPSKGYKDTKRPYPGGDLGKREDMSPLLRRMI